MATKTYIPGEVSVIIGTAIINDFESITIEYDEDFWNFSVGSGGEVTRTKNSSRLGTIIVEVPQTIEENLTLSAQAASDDTIPVNIIDTSGASVHTITTASILRIPTAGYAKNESGTREWACKGELDVNVVGGN